MGERNVEVLTAGLDAQDAMLVRRVVDIVNAQDDGDREG
jgi:hypothetical protein